MNRDDDIFEAPPDGFAMSPVHPGQVLEDEIAARGLTAHALGLKLRVPANRITDIINGKRGVSPDTALRLGRCLGPGAAFWLSLRPTYDFALAENPPPARRIGSGATARTTWR